MLEDKKGISPLLSTILLIVLSIAIGAAVMSWGRAYVEEAAGAVQERTEVQVSCQFDALAGVRKIGNEPSICFQDGTLKFLLENGGTVEINGISVSIIGNEISKTDVAVKLGPTDVENIAVAYPAASVGAIKQVQVTPKFFVGENQVCPKNVLILENIKSC